MLAKTGTNGCLMSKLILKARYIFSSQNNIIENGGLVVNGLMIDSVDAFSNLKIENSSKVIDFGNSIILPGFVNAHTHLELTNMPDLNIQDKKLTSWIMELVKTRLKWKEEDFVASVENGVRQCVETGTTTVADITNGGYSFEVLKNSRIRKIVYTEIINFDPAKATDLISDAEDKLDKVNQDSLMCKGVSPHAPYTVSYDLYKACSRLAKLKNIPLCTHIAETEDEVEFLSKGKGVLIDFLKDFRMLPDNWKAPGLTPVKYLKGCGILENRPLLVHCNYLSDDEIQIIRQTGSNVVFCPRSHRFFNHKNHPFKQLIDNGVPVALGTDSLASNYSLSMLDEIKFVYKNYDDIDPELILTMATINGAVALGLKDKTGKLSDGFSADIAVVRLEDEDKDNVLGEIFNDNTENVFTMVDGVVCFDKYNYAKLN